MLNLPEGRHGLDYRWVCLRSIFCFHQWTIGARNGEPDEVNIRFFLGDPLYKQIQVMIDMGMDQYLLIPFLGG